MTDLEALKAMLDRAGVVYTEGSDSTGFYITVEAGDNPQNGGYAGFVTCLEFTPTGVLTTVGAWE